MLSSGHRGQRSTGSGRVTILESFVSHAAMKVVVTRECLVSWVVFWHSHVLSGSLLELRALITVVVAHTMLLQPAFILLWSIVVLISHILRCA